MLRNDVKLKKRRELVEKDKKRKIQILKRKTFLKNF